MKKNLNLVARAAIVAASALVAMPTLSAAEVEGWGNFKLYLDPGHAGKENGGLYGYSEAEKVLRVAWNIRDMLNTYTDMPEECLKLCRETDTDQISLEERSDEANAWGADFYYSIHSDASAAENKIVTLFGGWTVDGVNIEKTPNGGKAYGEFLEPNLKSVMRIGSRGNRYDRDFYMPTTGTHENQYPYLSVNRRSHMPSLLSEGGYHTLAEQQSRNINDDYKRLEAFAAFQSILQYRGLNRPSQTFLTGVVSNSENNQPINGATITCGDKTYTTDTYESLFYKYTRNPNLIHNGFFVFEGLEAGSTVTLTYSAPGFETVTKEVTINSGGNISADYVTFADVALTNASPAKVDAISVSDLDNVNSITPMVITFSRNMNTTSVEEALSINNNGEIELSWVNPYTLSIDISKLKPLFSYTITIDGSVARNSQTNQLLDGDGDGVEGGDYVLRFTMAEPDLDAPEVVSTYPAAEGEALYSQRPPIRVEFNEQIQWNEDANNGWFKVVDSTGKEYTIGHTSHAIIGGKSVLHCYLDEDLAGDVAVLVTLQPVKDLYGNESEAIAFRFLSEYRAKLSSTMMYDLANDGTFWAPGGSGSSKGLAEEGTGLQSAQFSPFHGQNSSFGFTYNFDPDAEVYNWFIRCHNPKGSDVTMRGTDGIITMWVYGDGSFNQTGLLMRDFSSNALFRKVEALELDFRGWNLYTWDLTNDEFTQTLTQNTFTKIGTKWYLDAIFLDHNFPEDPVYEPDEEGYKEWAGYVAYNSMEFSKWDNDAAREAKIEDIDLPGSGVENVNVANGISISAAGSMLTVNADSAIESVKVFAVDGRLEMAAAPAANTAALSTAALAKGVHIVAVRTATGMSTVKVVL